MQKSYLFLGLGKSNLSIASSIHAGEKLALIEEEGFVLSSSLSSQSSQKIPGTLENVDFSSLLPATIFVSPGIDPRRPFFRNVEKFEKRELDYFCENFKGTVIAVTGTDGKSTFTTQLGHVLKKILPNERIFVGGNLGTPMCDALGKDFSLAILEVSSFQAERLKTAHMDFAILLNLAPDHLDRYDRVEDYWLQKWNLLKRARFSLAPKDLKPPFAFKQFSTNYSNNASMRDILQEVIQVIATHFKVTVSKDAFENLPVLPHRLERWVSPSGVTFVNDSKATTVHAVSYALRMLKGEFSSLQLILGGSYKGDDFSRLIPDLRTSDRVLLYGEAASTIAPQLEGLPSKCQRFSNLKTLLQEVVPKLKQGECLVLSPGCSSYDEFENFEARGNFFLSQVKDRAKS